MLERLVVIKLGSSVIPSVHGSNVNRSASDQRFIQELRRRLGDQFPELQFDIRFESHRGPRDSSITMTGSFVDAHGNVVHNPNVGNVLTDLLSDESAWLVRN